MTIKYTKLYSDIGINIILLLFPCLLPNTPYVYFVLPVYYGFFVHSYLNFFHEGAHYNLHSSKKINDIISNLLFSFLTLQKVQNYRISHWKHHAHLGSLKDTEISYKESGNLTQILKQFFFIYQINKLRQKNKDSSSVSITYPIFMFSFFILLAIEYQKLALFFSFFTGYIFFYPLFARLRQTLEHRPANCSLDEKNIFPSFTRNFSDTIFSYFLGSAGFKMHKYHHDNPHISYTLYPKLKDLKSYSKYIKDIF